MHVYNGLAGSGHRYNMLKTCILIDHTLLPSMKLEQGVLMVLQPYMGRRRGGCLQWIGGVWAQILHGQSMYSN